jgi:thiol-disulfide isomerase/thioredoxin
MGVLWSSGTCSADDPAPTEVVTGIEEPETATPLEEFEAIRKAYRLMQMTNAIRLRKAKTDEEKQQVLAEMTQPSTVAAKYLALVDKYPNDPVAAKSLVAIITTLQGAGMYDEILDRILAQYRDSDQLVDLCFGVQYAAANPKVPALLQELKTHNPHREVQAAATYSLARLTLNQERRANASGGGTVDTQEAERLLEEVVGKFADVQVNMRTLGTLAEGDLFEIRNLAIGKVAPEIQGENVEGAPLSLEAHRGKVVVMTFWGTWCGPCRAMLPHEKEMVERLADKPFAMLGVNSDQDREELKKFLADENIGWQMWFDGGTGGPISTRWNVHAWPTIYVLDAEGKIRFKNVRGEALERAVHELMEELAAQSVTAAGGE